MPWQKKIYGGLANEVAAPPFTISNSETIKKIFFRSILIAG
jgi:hypothetical protein